MDEQNSPGGRTININEKKSHRTIKIDDLNLEECKFIKIDVEGREPKVLEGAQKTINRFRPYILCEINTGALNHHGFTKKDILKYIPNNYETKLITDWDELYVPK